MQPTSPFPNILRITGGRPIDGTIHLGGNKNAALPLLVAALLTDEPIILHNMPDILDVKNMLKIEEFLGVKVTRESNGTIILQRGGLALSDIPRELCTTTRTSLLFAGPLAALLGKSAVYLPGGDSIGRRRIDGHLYGLRQLGIQHANPEKTKLEFQQIIPPKGAEIFLDEASVTATEHILLTAALVPGETQLINAASEPHVTQLVNLLQAMGVSIDGAGSNLLTIRGRTKLHGAEITVEADHIEAASFLSLCACTGGSIELTGTIRPSSYWMTRRVFEKFGLNFLLTPQSIRMKCQPHPKVQMDEGAAIPTISDGTWPQFPSDMMSCLLIMATQAVGTTIFFEKLFESRLYFVDKLQAMGANAIICDPHRVVVSGPAHLHGIELSSPDIRAGMAMVLAACCAEGTSILNRADIIYRGYGNLLEKLQALGVDAQGC